MSLIGGTVFYTDIETNNTYFLVTDEVPQPNFYTVKMHRHNDETALGAILNGFKNELALNLDNLRLGELAGWHMKSDADLIALYTFEVVNPAIFDHERLSMLGMHFANAKDLNSLLTTVDMNGFGRLD